MRLPGRRGVRGEGPGVRGGGRGGSGRRPQYAERVLRAAAYTGAALALLLAVLPGREGPRTRPAGAPELASVLARPVPAGDTLAVATDTALDAVHRDWLAALRAAGTGVRWGGRIPALALALEPLPDPGGGGRVLVAAPSGAGFELGDSVGPVDTASAISGGYALAVPRLLGAARASLGGQGARAAAADSLVLRRIVVFGGPGWETKFVIAALEERGWTVDARIPLSPEAALVQGAPARLDTARVTAVVALDRSAARFAAAISGYVRDGGGLVLAASAASDPAFRSLRAGVPGRRRPAEVLEISTDVPRRGLGFFPVTGLAPATVPLERRDGLVTVAARRFGAGRVVQTGYDETWPWRMSGPEGSVLAHRLWWAGLVGSAAYQPTVSRAEAVRAEDAPLASMVATLGPPDPDLPAAGGSGGGSWEPPFWLFAATLGALLAEWASRRLRGAA